MQGLMTRSYLSPSGLPHGRAAGARLAGKSLIHSARVGRHRRLTLLTIGRPSLPFQEAERFKGLLDEREASMRSRQEGGAADAIALDPHWQYSVLRRLVMLMSASGAMSMDQLRQHLQDLRANVTQPADEDEEGEHEAAGERTERIVE